MNVDIEYTDIPVECDVHGPQVVKRIKSIGGEQFHFNRPDCQPGCPLCLDERIALQNREFEEECRRAMVNGLIKASRLPLRYQDVTFDHYLTALPAQKRALEICKRYSDSVASQGHAGWLVLSGRPGTGKTMLLSCMAVALAHKNIFSRYITQTSMGREFRATYQRNAERSETELFDYYAKHPVLLLDELGASSTEHTDRIVFEILDARYADRRPVVIATNHPRGELRNVLGERLFDRLTEEATFLAFDWESSRKPAGLSTRPTS